MPFATLSATCDQSIVPGDLYTGTPIQAAHSNVIVRYKVASESADFYFYDGPADVTAATGDVIWGPGRSLSANESPVIGAGCFKASSDVAFTAEFFDQPTAPAEFSGVGNAGGSILDFRAPGVAQYVADLTLGRGVVRLAGVPGGQNFASNGQFALGTLSAGDHSMGVTALDGPTPSWKVSIHALPVALNSLAFVPAAARPGAFVQAKYASSGDTTVSATVRDGLGAVVKTLAADLGVGPGDHSLSWDTRGDAGQSLADGTYTLRLDSRDPSQLTGTASTTIKVDGTPPEIAITTPGTLASYQAVSGRIKDALTGIASAQVQDLSANRRLSLPAGRAAFSVAPPRGGWTAGAHQLAVTATDGAGNQQKRRYSFKVKSSPRKARRRLRTYKCPDYLPHPEVASDEVGTRIRARGTSCLTARKLVADYYYRAETGNTLYGVLIKYRCRSRIVRTGLTHSNLRCTRGSRKLITATLY